MLATKLYNRPFAPDVQERSELTHGSSRNFVCVCVLYWNVTTQPVSADMYNFLFFGQVHKKG